MAFYLQGKYRPVNPQKYRGDVRNIVFRSSLELVAFKFCDTNPGIVFWSSEEEIIPYLSPIDNRMHRYFMDLKVWTKSAGSPELVTTLIEIKPKDQTKQPKKTPTMKESTYKTAMMTWMVNQAKWSATEKLCSQRGWNFVKWTEENLDPSKDPEIKRRFAIRSKKRREVEVQDKKNQAQIAAIKKRLLAEAKKETQPTTPKKTNLLP